MSQAAGEPIALLNHNRPTAYLLSAELYEMLLDQLEDHELAQIVRERGAEKEAAFEVNIDDPLPQVSAECLERVEKTRQQESVTIRDSTAKTEISRKRRPCEPLLLKQELATYNAHMRVLLVSKALVVGAYQRKAEEIARCGVDLTVMTPPAWQDSRGKQIAEPTYTKGYELLVAPVRFNGRFHLHHYPTLARELTRLQPDVLHVDEEPYNFATWHGLRAAAKLGVPATFFTWQNLNRRYPLPFSRLEQDNYRRAPIAIAGNRDAADVLRAKGYAGEIEVIPQFGVDPDIFSPQKFDSWDQHLRPAASSCGETAEADRPFIIGYAGGLLPEKGLDTLVSACVRLEPGWRLLLAGEGGQQGALAQLAERLGAASAVEFAGRIPSGEMADFYHRLDALVLPSRTTTTWKEQFGRVLIEAMACGIPVIGSDSGEIPNVIGNAGRIFAEGDVDALALQLRRLQADPAERQQLAEAGRQRVLDQFTMHSVAEETVKVYERLLR